MFANGFIDESVIANKSGAAWDSRQCETQTRTHAETYGVCFFDNLNGWVSSPSCVSIVATNSPDPAIGNVVSFDTGPNLGSPSFIQKSFPLIPEKFGLAIFPALVNVDTLLADSLFLQVQKTVNDKNLQVRFSMSGVYVFISGQWQKISTHGNTSWCEWWLEVDEVNGADTVSIYAGTQFIDSVSGNLPNGPSGNSGLVYIGQDSGANANRKSQVAYFALGESQLFDDLSITTIPYSLPVSAAALSGVLIIEDVSASLAPNVDIFLEISVGGDLFEAVTLISRGELCKGVIDSAKSVLILTGTLLRACPIGLLVRARIQIRNHKFVGVHGFSILPTSTM